jgi:hypothetical protein
MPRGANPNHVSDGLSIAERRAAKRAAKPKKPPKPPKVKPQPKPRVKKPRTPEGEWRPHWVRKQHPRYPQQGESLESYVERKRWQLKLKADADRILAAEGLIDTHGKSTGVGAPAEWLSRGPAGEVRDAIYHIMCDLDEPLIAKKHRKLAQSWKAILHDWLCKTSALTLTIRKGRRVGASTIIAPRLITAWIKVVGPRLELPPGETVVVGLVSVRRGEAANRIAQISAVLTACEMKHEVTGEEIRLVGAPLKICVLTRNWRSAVGDNLGLLWCDEVSRWESEDSSANPASEVISSLKPTLATLQAQGFALMVLSSSPWSEDDYHATQYARGDTADQHVAFLPTWVGNPTLSESMTHILEPDERVWNREYAAIPGNVLSQALDSEDVNAAFGMVVPAGDLRRWCCIDASSLRGDAFAWMIGHEARGGLVVDKIGGWSDSNLRDLSLDNVVNEIALECRARSITRVWGDQREEAGLEVLFRQQRLSFESFAWTNPSKHDAFTMLRRLLRDRRVQLVEHATLQTQMRTCKARLLPGGATSYETNGLDYLSALITLIHGYERYYPQALSQILAGRILDVPVSDEERKKAELEAQRIKYRKQAEKRARNNSAGRY